MSFQKSDSIKLNLFSILYFDKKNFQKIQKKFKKTMMNFLKICSFLVYYTKINIIFSFKKLKLQ